MMTQEEVTEQWKDFILPMVQEAYEKDGQPDWPARRESWNNYTDTLCKDGEITVEEYETWGQPSECGE